MRKLFDLDNPVFMVIARLADLTVLGLLCLVCCLPVVTFGPAITALFKVVYDLTLERGSGLIKRYFRAFRDNFKQALGGWLLALLGFVSLGCDWFLLRLYFDGTAYTVLAWVVLIFAVAIVAMICYVFPLIARYENTLQEHIRNAGILAVRYFPKTLVMVFLHLLPLLMANYLPYALLATLLFWILFYLGLTSQADAVLLRPVFEKLEDDAARRDAGETEENEKAEEEFEEP